MCLHTTKESFKKASKARKEGKDIIAYKIIQPNGKAFFHPFTWPNKGKVESNRKSTRRTHYEVENQVVHEGLHLFVEEPEKCQYPYRYPCPYPCPCLYRRYWLWCIHKNPANKILKVKVKAKDIVSYGIWDGLQSVVVTKCEVLGEAQ